MIFEINYHMIFKSIIIWFSNRLSYDFRIDYHMIFKTIIIWLSNWFSYDYLCEEGKSSLSRSVRWGERKGEKRFKSERGKCPMMNDEWWMSGFAAGLHVWILTLGTLGCVELFVTLGFAHEKPTHLQSMWRTASVGRLRRRTTERVLRDCARTLSLVPSSNSALERFCFAVSFPSVTHSGAYPPSMPTER